MIIEKVLWYPDASERGGALWYNSGATDGS